MEGLRFVVLFEIYIANARENRWVGGNARIENLEPLDSGARLRCLVVEVGDLPQDLHLPTHAHRSDIDMT